MDKVTINIKIFSWVFLLLLVSGIGGCASRQNATPEVPQLTQIPKTGNSIRPYTVNPYYWQYHGVPVVLLGGSQDDNFFQIPNLKKRLDLMQRVGANYLRNTMSGRDDGNAKAFKQLSNGKYDLDQWNDRYWDRFENFLKLTNERQIFVQIELWDQWDHNEVRWNTDPWNPNQNVNYTTENTQLKGDGNYQQVLSNRTQKHDLFLTVPKLHNDSLVLKYQKKFVNRVLSIASNYDNVLYTITNELFKQHSIEWSLYWTNYIQKKAKEAGKSAQITEMLQDEDITDSRQQEIYDDKNTFNFIDISQNSTQTKQSHWDHLEWVRSYIKNSPRPINHTKIYGSNQVSWTKGKEQGIERFWRNILGGAASVRFHRPDAGLGLSSEAQTQIRSARILLNEFNIFNAKPDANSQKLSDRGSNEAYLSYTPGKQYAVYFPGGGSVKLDLTDVSGTYHLKWLNIESSLWGDAHTISGGKKVALAAPDKSSWVALITAKK